MRNEYVGGACFDLCLNGNELGSGSLRIHNADLQRAVLHKLGLDDERIEQNFGFFIQALSFGAPPHGGIAIGVDRLCAILLNKDTIREVIAFPKVQNASELMSACPSAVDKENLDILGIAVTETE